MKQLLGILLLATSLQAADWSGAAWEPLCTLDRGHFHSAMRGLQCRGDSIFLVVPADSGDPMNGLEYSVYRIALNGTNPGNAFTILELPPDLRQSFRDIGYDSVDRARPELMTRFRLWTLSGSEWQSTQLLDSIGEPIPGLGCFSYDSSGALHFVSGYELWGSDYLSYHRQGGGHAARDTSFYGDFEYGFITGTYIRIWNPTTNSVMIGCGSLDVPVNYEMYHLYFFSSENGSSFGRETLLTNIHGKSPQVTLSPWGNWYYSLRNECYSTIWTYRGGGVTHEMIDPFFEPMSAWQIIADSHDSTFAGVGFAAGPGPMVVSITAMNRSNGVWEEDTTVFDTPAEIPAIYGAVDAQGCGHLFALDSTTLWHFGCPIMTSNVVEKPAFLPDQIRLSAAPNPFNGSTRIKFTLPASGHVELTIFDALGRKVANLENGRLEAGFHERVFDADFLPTGLYFVKLSSESQTQYGKLVLIK